jgi:site-specific DNA-cytosine methylase
VIANISHRGSVVDAIDFYCGYGGSAQGIIAAGADIKAAANHNQLALECYNANYPTARTYRADLVDPDSCGFGHKVKFVGHKMRILSVIK